MAYQVCNTEMSGAELDVFWKLHHKGWQDDGDLPSKSGMCGLIEKGLFALDCLLDALVVGGRYIFIYHQTPHQTAQLFIYLKVTGINPYLGE